jgi:hypothetical protein
VKWNNALRKKINLYLLFLLLLCACINQAQNRSNAEGLQTIAPQTASAGITTGLPTSEFISEQSEDLPENGLSLIRSTISLERLRLGELVTSVLENEYFIPFFSPDGQWIASMDYVNGHLDLLPINDPMAIRVIDLPDHLVPSSVYDWAPDSSGFVYTGYGEGGIFTPFVIVNILDGDVQMETPYNDDDGYYHSLTWSITGDELYVPELLFDENIIRLFRFNRQMELQSTTDIPVELFRRVVDIDSISDGIVIVVNNDEHVNPTLVTSHVFSDYSTFLYYYSFSDSELTLIDHVSGSQHYRYCGDSADSNRIAFLSYSSYHREDNGYFSIYDLSSQSLISYTAINNQRYDGCEYSLNQPLLAFTTSTGSSSGLVIVDLDELNFQFIEGDYQLLGWNNSYGGFTVLDRSQEDNYLIEVIRFQ